jgi:hypothetical protein
MARSSKTADVVAQAERIMPTLEKVQERLEQDPQGVVSRVFPEADPGFQPSSTNGETEGQEGLESTGAMSENSAVHRLRLRLTKAASSAIRKVRQGGKKVKLTDEETAGLEAIVLTTGRPAILFRHGHFLTPPSPWEELEESREQIEASARSVGRIELAGNPMMAWVGTGYVVADGVILTNRHVAFVFSQQGRGENWTFKAGLKAGIDYIDAPEDGQPAAYTLKEIIGVHDRYDLALFRLGKGAGRKSPPPAIPVASKAPARLKGRTVYVLGYPARDPRNGELAMRNIFGDIYNVKRLQPGTIMNFQKAGKVFQHDSSTLGGNSGSCVLDLETHQVLGLHFGGIYLKYNKAVALWALTRDPLLRKAKVNFV